MLSLSNLQDNTELIGRDGSLNVLILPGHSALTEHTGGRLFLYPFFSVADERRL